jgi:hypothetical protein
MASRTPESPEALVQRIRELFDEHAEWNSLSRVDAFVEAGGQLLRRVLEATTEARAVALDLLAADACITYAFEAAADDPGTLAAHAESAKTKIALVASEYGERGTRAAGVPQ